MLRELGDLVGHQFKSRAYNSAANTLSLMSDYDFNNRENFRDLPGIGESINSKILEFKNSGSISKLEELRNSNSGYLDPTLYKIRKSFITKRLHISDPLLMKIKSDIENYLVQYAGDKYDFAGSYRRGSNFIADLDVIIYSGEAKSKIEESLSKSSMFECTAWGGTKSSWRYLEYHNITVDINLASEDCKPFALLHHTGSAANNIRMRSIAKSLGMVLNQYGLFPQPEANKATVAALESTRFETEQDIFRFLGIEYLEPSQR